MKTQESVVRGYSVQVGHMDGGSYYVSYLPRGLQHERGKGREPKRAVEKKFTGQLRVQPNASVKWEARPTNDDKDLERFNDDARLRVKTLHEWLTNLNGLVESVQGWAQELGWSTKVIQKAMDDSQIGSYKAPALLLQEETTRVLLEPITRMTPASNGVVDLYLMPAYEDIASLAFYDKKWHIHYLKPQDVAIAGIREAQSKPLSKTSFRQVLEEMKSHAG